METVNRLKNDLNDQELLLTDVKITCIPENKNENLIHLVRVVGEKLDVKIAEHDIVSIEWFGQ